jgi:RNA polymerase subunit RPABC4/transcription elongation factor Spt4
MNDPCPACGSDDITVTAEMTGYRARWHCNKCGARGTGVLAVAPSGTPYTALVHSVPLAGSASPVRACQDCGDAVPLDARFCISCGATLVATGKTTRL